MNNFPLLAIVVMLSFATYSSAQHVVLVNGQASEVLLDGTVITSVINSDLAGHMNEFEQAPTSLFSKKPLRIETPGIVLNKRTIAAQEIAALDPTQTSTVYTIVE